MKTTKAWALALSAATTLFTGSAMAGDALLSEVRIGALKAPVFAVTDQEDGIFITGMALFDPFGYEAATGFHKALVPRIHVGGDVSTVSGVNQAFAGFTWTQDYTERFFTEIGFGGTIHDGPLTEDGLVGPDLGCRALFHEYLAAGVNIDQNWRVIGQVEHSSHGGLCDGLNDGITRAGVLVGYKF